MFQVYILQSLKTRRYYVGSTEDVVKRLEQHNDGRVISTKGGRPWKVIHTEIKITRSEAVQREREIKAYKGGILFKKMIGTWVHDRYNHGEVA